MLTIIALMLTAKASLLIGIIDIGLMFTMLKIIK